MTILLSLTIKMKIFYEKVATADETTLDQYLELGKIEDSAVKN